MGVGREIKAPKTAAYRKNPKSSDTEKNCCNYLKIETVSFYYRAMGPKEVDGMAKSVDPDLGAVWSRSTLFAQNFCPITDQTQTVQHKFHAPLLFKFSGGSRWGWGQSNPALSPNYFNFTLHNSDLVTGSNVMRPSMTTMFSIEMISAV